jgi:hypothetical protein
VDKTKAATLALMSSVPEMAIGVYLNEHKVGETILRVMQGSTSEFVIWETVNSWGHYYPKTGKMTKWDGRKHRSIG